MGFLAIVGFIIAGLGAVAAIAGALMMLIAAFRESKGIGCGMLVPGINSIVSLYFLIAYWSEAKKPFLIQLVGTVGVFLGLSLAGVNAEDELTSEMSGYYDEYYEEDESEGESSLPSTLNVQQQRQRAAERQERVEEPEEESEDTFGADTSLSSSSRTTPQRLVRKEHQGARPEEKVQAPKRIVGEVSAASLDQHLGRLITITKTSGKLVRGKLIRTDADSVTVEKRLGGGKMAFPIAKSDIDTVVLGR